MSALIRAFSFKVCIKSFFPPLYCVIKHSRIARKYASSSSSSCSIPAKPGIPSDCNPPNICRKIFQTNIAVPSELKDLPSDIFDKMIEVQTKSGFLPTIFILLSRRPKEFRAFFNYYEILMDEQHSESELTLFEKEMIVVATSAVNNCLYCVIAHGAMLRVFAKKYESMADYNLVSDQISVDYQKSDLVNDKQKAMVSYALKLAKDPQSINDEDIEILLNLGFSVEAVWDIGSITAFFSLSNRIAHMSALMPNPEFYEIARKPPPPKGK